MGRSTSGVKGMRFREGDALLTMEVVREGADLLIVTESGYAKRTPVEEYPTKGRGTLGVRVGKLSEERGGLVGALMTDPEEDVMVITESGKLVQVNASDVRPTGKLVQVNASDVRPTARNTMGVIFARPDTNDRIIAITRNPERELPEEEVQNSGASVDEAADQTVVSEQNNTAEGEQ